MMPIARLALFALLLGAAACQGRRAAEAQGAPDGARAADPSPGPTPVCGPSRGSVFLSDRDLAPVDAFVSARNAQWILGDDVEVVASREYFAQALSVNAAVGLVNRTDTTRLDETIVELVYAGPPGAVNVTTSPRILIGTGLTITARRRLVLHLVKTTDANVPVRLRVTAQGEAARGRREEVLERGPLLRLGGEIRRTTAGWSWFPLR